MTADRALMAPQHFDAVVFHMYYLRMRLLPFLNWGKFPPARSPQQRYVFFLLESPANCGSSYAGMHHLFNWTMTYRLDSDVAAPYGEVRPRAGVRLPARGRRRRRGGGGGPGSAAVVAWLVSHCATQSKRESLVAQLSQHVHVQVFGDCGAPWPKDDLPGFYRMLLARGYKFYLSFENSLCKDYVTEKLFNILQLDIVPVVYGAANYSAVVPPHSYIDARAFASPRHLAAYLSFLAERPDEYAKFFWWKRYYEVLPDSHNHLCRLCEKLHQPLPDKSYADVADWWNGDGVCQEPDAALADLGG
ncbi:Alpha-(1,3)-fucosyltransferase C [Gryllus bimaculatus]|nr:Alpha-(1,3)-fucosyltransferase C [Gryllus bimaculatus]